MKCLSGENTLNRMKKIWSGKENGKKIRSGAHNASESALSSSMIVVMRNRVELGGSMKLDGEESSRSFDCYRRRNNTL